MSVLTAADIILRPVISEKSIDESGRGKYTFAVHDKANKIQIKAAVEELYKKEKVTVVAVNVLTSKAKEKRRGTKRGRDRRPHLGVAQGDRHPGPRPEDRILRGGVGMPLRSYKATSPGRRWMTRSTFEEITTDKPHKPLLEPMKRGSGRNNQGRLTVRHRGGGEKTHYRIGSTSSATSSGVPAQLATIEYDPNRSARIGLLHYRDGEKRYMLLPNGLKVGDIVVSGPDAEARVGNALPIAKIPLGTTIHNIELDPRQGRPDRPVRRRRRPSSWPRRATTPRSACPRARCAGCSIRCMATIGQVSNVDHENQNLGKAGRARHMGQRPEVRGVAMTPRDHPHGGGEGKSPTGMPPKTPWGKPAMGYRTRRGKATSRLIVRSRHRKS